MKESEGSNAKVMKIDCIVTYKGKRVTTGVSWTDGKGKVLSKNSHLEMALKAGANVARCVYYVDGWSGSKTLTKMLTIGGHESSTSGKESAMRGDEASRIESNKALGDGSAD